MTSEAAFENFSITLYNEFLRQCQLHWIINSVPLDAFQDKMRNAVNMVYSEKFADALPDSSHVAEEKEKLERAGIKYIFSIHTNQFRIK
jgi:hypothetical protein